MPWATGLAIVLYLVPVFAMLVARARRSVEVGRLALTVPEVVAIDTLTIMVAARVVRLETAVLLSRPLWLAGVLANEWRDRSRSAQGTPHGPRHGVTLKHALSAAGAAAAAFELSTLLSRPYHLWDRHWHTPLVALLRGERIPFDNTYEPGRALHYHLAGDVLGSMFQTLSLDFDNASLALSVAHDVMFALIAGAVTLLLFGVGFKRAWPAPLAALALLLQGPATMRGKLGTDFYGYSFDNLLITGFRPHVSLAGLLIVGFVGAVGLQLLARPGTQPRGTTGVMFACGILLSITDEASTGVLLLALAGTWCIAKTAVGSTRLEGVLTAASLGAAMFTAHRLLGGSLAPGGPLQSLRWVAPRSPGTQYNEPLTLTSARGWVALTFDFLPLLACALGLAMAGWKRPRAPGAVAFAWGTLVVAMLLMTQVEVNHAHAETQRFVIAPSFAVFLLALFLLPRVAHGALASVLVNGGLALSAFSTLSWLQQRVSDADPERADRDQPNLYEVDCRASSAAHFGERPVLAYFEETVFGAYAGCHPSYAAGRMDEQWGIKILPDLWPQPQLTTLDSQMVGPNDDLMAICPRHHTEDLVCVEAERTGSCVDKGRDMRRCVLTPSDRKRLLEALEEGKTR